MKYGIWIESPGEWTGWSPLFVWGDKAVPWKFKEIELDAKLARARKAYPNARLIESREAPDEIAWNETGWRKAKA